MTRTTKKALSLLLHAMYKYQKPVVVWNFVLFVSNLLAVKTLLSRSIFKKVSYSFCLLKIPSLCIYIVLLFTVFMDTDLL